MSGGGWQDKNMQEHLKPVQETQETPEPIDKKNPDLETQKKAKLSSAAAVRKSAVHGCASRFHYVKLDPPCKRTS